jgi:ATP-binding cassette subfamily C protein
MTQVEFGRGQQELRKAIKSQSGLLWAVFLFSVFVNLLLLTGPLYMLQVYDRVLGSRSEATLLALSLLVVFLFIIMGILDFVRARVMSRIGAKVQDSLDLRVFSAALKRIGYLPGDPLATAAQRDLEAIQRLWASSVLMAVFDIPWALLFFATIFVFHPVLGWASVVGGLVLVVVTVMNQRMTQGPINQANGNALRAELMSDQIKHEAESIQALGMVGAAFSRWQGARQQALGSTLEASDLTGTFTAVTKTFRLFLQSAMLGLGALLVLEGQLTAGAMIAASILLGRALAPIEQSIGQWGIVTRAQEANRRLSELLSRVPPEPHRTVLPRPKALLEVANLTVVPPGESVPVLKVVNFRLEPGQALGVIGPSGAGKSSLARALIGAWRPANGNVRLDGATLDQYDPDILGSYIGYLPQRITLFEGTIAENISRLSPQRDDAKIVDAAQLAAAHDMITRLPDGYDTKISAIGGRLSGGQMQRIGLARALYGDPILLVLDEPNSNLDNDGSMALNLAIRAMKDKGRSILIMAHRPAAIQECDMLLVLEDGARRAFGPRDTVLREMVKNHTDIVRSSGPGGVS